MSDMAKPMPSGAELERRGIMKFECPECRNLFPVRCDRHKKLATPKDEEKPAPEPPPVPVQPHRQPTAQTAAPLASSKVILGYDAPYERLVTEISTTLKSAP